MKLETIVSRVQLTSVGVPYEWIAARFGGRAELPASRLAKEAHPAVASFLRRHGYEGDIEELAVEVASEKPPVRSDAPEKAVFLEATGPLRYTPPSSPLVHVTAVDSTSTARWFDPIPAAGLTLGGTLALEPKVTADMVIKPHSGAFRPEYVTMAAFEAGFLGPALVTWHSEGFEIPVSQLMNASEPTPMFGQVCTPDDPLRLTFENHGPDRVVITATLFGHRVRQ
jgi:hypothetical protein